MMLLATVEGDQNWNLGSGGITQTQKREKTASVRLGPRGKITAAIAAHRVLGGKGFKIHRWETSFLEDKSGAVYYLNHRRGKTDLRRAKSEK